ncbi:hypothetical protein ACXJJ3_30420 [Kribbella sp. WER1]
MPLYYVDTSAALKLLVEATHSRAFAAFYDEAEGAAWVSSALLRIEVMRAVTRVFPALLPDARDLPGYGPDGVTYDDRLAEAANDAGFDVVSPRS